MILKELYVISLKEKQVIKKYVFNEYGLNVILGVAKKDSNGVGKSANDRCNPDDTWRKNAK